MDIFAQIIGIVAMTFNILSYQGKNAKGIVLMQCIGGALFTVNFFMLGAMTGAMLNVFSVARALFLLFVKKPKKIWLVPFILVIFGMYAMSFLVFKTPATTKNLIVEALPTIAQIMQTVVFFFCGAKKIRYFSYGICPLWLAYNIICFSIGGILCETFALISITVGIIRYGKHRPFKMSLIREQSYRHPYVQSRKTGTFKMSLIKEVKTLPRE